MRSTRRFFLIGGGLLGGGVLLGVTGVLGALAFDDRRARQRAALAENGERLINLWLVIEANNTLTLLVPHTEMGQGSRTGLKQIVADELDMDWEQVTLQQSPSAVGFTTAMVLQGFVTGGGDSTGLKGQVVKAGFARLTEYMNMQITGGSTAIRFTGWWGMRVAAAAAREMLLTAASERLNVPAIDLRTQAGQVIPPSGPPIPYADLVQAAGRLAVPNDPRTKSPDEYRYIGRSMPRIDLPDKIFARAEYGIDVVVPEMRYAAVKNAPSIGGEITAITNEDNILARRGVESVHIIPGGVGVVADNPWRAEQAVRAVTFETSASPNAALTTEALEQQQRDALETGELTELHTEGDLKGALTGDGLISAEYRVPYLAHAPMEPLNATVWREDGKLHVASGVQSPLGARIHIAEQMGVDDESVIFHAQTMGGGFGRRAAGGEDTFNFLTQAVELFKASGVPVKMIWSREQEIRASRFRPLSVARFRAKLGRDGRPVAWEGKSYGAITEAEQAVPPYRIPNQGVHHVDAEPFLPFAYWRSVDASSHCFFVESFIDELAVAAGADPLTYRRDLLDGAAREVVEAVGEFSGWRTGVGADGRAYGVALTRCFGSTVAEVASVSMNNGRPRVHDVWCVVDCGRVINPSAVEAQIQGGVIYGLTAALFGKIDLKDGAIVQSNFHDYPILKMDEAPRVHVRVLQRDAPPQGVGEVGTPAIAPAVANAMAVFGDRRRRLPLLG